MSANALGQPSGGRAGGVYIPPFKLALLKQQQAQEQDGDKNDPANAENQKLSWEALRKSINGLINKVNVSNLKHIVPELFQENLIRGRGLFARAILKAQQASPSFTHIYASLVSVINTKLPENGELILKRVIYGFKRAYKRKDKMVAAALARFIAHLVNHQVAHEIVALQLLTVLLEDPTDDSVEIAVGFVKEVGQRLEELSPQGLHFVFERFRQILHEGDIDKRVQYTVEGLFAVRKGGFKDYPAIPEELDLVEREDQITFELGLDDEVDREELLDVFKVDPNFAENEEMWEQIRREILGDDEEDDEGPGDADADADGAAEGGDEVENGDAEMGMVPAAGVNAVVDLTEQDLVNLRRSIYLTIMSSVSYEECCHKLMKLSIPEGYESELCNMIIECCSNERSYLRFYGLMGQRFCMIHRKFQDAFDQAFLTQYSTIHRLETNKLRNVAKFFAHLLSTDALPWTCFEYIKLNEFDTTSSSRIFIKVMVQDLAEYLGLKVLKERFNDPYMEDIFSGMFPTDNARNTRFSINYFTSIGLGGLTDTLREHLKNAPKLLALQMQAQLLEQQRQQEQLLLRQHGEKDNDTASDSDSSSDSSSSSSSSSTSSTGSSTGNSTGSSSSNSTGSSSSSESDDSDSSESDSSSGSSSASSRSASASVKRGKERRSNRRTERVVLTKCKASPPNERTGRTRRGSEASSSSDRVKNGRGVARLTKRADSASRSPSPVRIRASSPGKQRGSKSPPAGESKRVLIDRRVPSEESAPRRRRSASPASSGSDSGSDAQRVRRRKPAAVVPRAEGAGAESDESSTRTPPASVPPRRSRTNSRDMQLRRRAASPSRSVSAPRGERRRSPPRVARGRSNSASDSDGDKVIHRDGATRRVREGDQRDVRSASRDRCRSRSNERRNSRFRGGADRWADRRPADSRRRPKYVPKERSREEYDRTRSRLSRSPGRQQRRQPSPAPHRRSRSRSGSAPGRAELRRRRSRSDSRSRSGRLVVERTKPKDSTRSRSGSGSDSSSEAAAGARKRPQRPRGGSRTSSRSRSGSKSSTGDRGDRDMRKKQRTRSISP